MDNKCQTINCLIAENAQMLLLIRSSPTRIAQISANEYLSTIKWNTGTSLGCNKTSNRLNVIQYMVIWQTLNLPTVYLAHPEIPYRMLQRASGCP